MQDSHEAKIVCDGLSSACPVSFAIFALARSHRARAASLLADIGLFPGQELLLMTLAAKDGAPQKSLCDSMSLDHSTIAKSLARLEKSGLIERHKGAEDGRVSNVFITDKGREATAAISRVWAELEQLTVADLTAEERQEMVKLSGKIVPRMEIGG